MIKIAICDDEVLCASKLKSLVSEYMQKKQLGYEIDIYSSGVELCELGVEVARYQIVFLDINMAGLDGIETAKKLREFCKELFIVFVTADIHYTLEGYKVEAIRYVLKNTPDFRETIFESLDAICEKMNCVAGYESFDFREGKKKFSIDRIAYIESNLHMLHFWVLERDYVEYTLYGTLNDLEDRFRKYDFVRVHQSYLVNLKFIANVVNYKVYLVNGTVLSAPRSKFKYVRERFASYKGEIR